MNYIEIINKTLAELNYAPVNAFSELTKTEHTRLMSIINRLNKEICSMNDTFYFRQALKKQKLCQNKSEYNVEINGRVSKVLNLKGEEYTFEPDYTKFYLENIPEKKYSFYGAKFLFSPSDDEVRIFYSVNDFVISKNGDLKSDFELESDKSIIPDVFAERLFVNGGAYNFKQNSSHPKYLHWKQEYDKALKEVLSDAKRMTESGIMINGGYRKL